MPAVVAALHELIERPVAIINRWGDVLASMSFESSDQPQMDEDDLLQEMARSERLGLTWHKASGRWLAPFWQVNRGD